MKEAAVPLVYVVIPLVSALIGWFTNFVAVRMIFRPRRPVRVLGLRVQGLMPRRQAELARTIGETIESTLLTHEDIHASLRDPEVHREIERLIAARVDTFFAEKLGGNPMVAMFLQGETAAKIKGMLIEQLTGSLPEFVDTVMDRVQERMDLKAIVQRRIEEFDLATLESIVYRIAARELKLIEIVGGVLGLLVGLGQVGILLLAR